MRFFFIILGFVFSQLFLGQVTQVMQNNEMHTIHLPLYIVNGQETYRNCSSIGSNNIESINACKAEKSTLLYGEKVPSGRVEITLKPNVRLLRLHEFYKEYKISKKNQKLPIVLNKHFVNEKKYLLLDTSTVVFVAELDEQPFVEPVLLPKGKAIYIETQEK